MNFQSFSAKITSILAVAMVLFFVSCKKEGDPQPPSGQDLTVQFTGNYTGTFVTEAGNVHLTQKVKITKISNTEVKVENNGGPASFSAVTYKLSVSASMGNNIAGVGQNDATLALSSNGVAAIFPNDATYAGVRQ